MAIATTASPAGKSGPVDELRLLDAAERVARSDGSRFGIRIHLSRLQSHNRREHHIRVASGVFADLVTRFDGALFHLKNRDIVFICREGSAESLEAVILRLRYLFSEDPLTRLVGDQGEAGFCTWYRFPHDAKSFAKMARLAHDLAIAQSQDEPAGISLEELDGALGPGHIERLATRLQGLDVAALMRNQSICAVTRSDPPQPVMEELYVSISDLERALIPGVSLASNPWLFQYLTVLLDQRLLSQLIHETHMPRRPFTINLNTATVLSKDFQRFDESIATGVRGRVVIELQKIDIFHDMGAYVFARDYLHERNYKVCLDGLTYLTLPFIDRDRLGLDFLKMYWSEDLFQGIQRDSKHMQEIRDQISDCGQTRMILCRCDSMQAIRLGHELGITLFQGRYIDQMIARTRARHGLRPKVV